MASVLGGLLRMGYQSSLLPVWCQDPMEVGVLVTELGERLVRAVPDCQGTLMVARCATSHS